jgi:hypothetical protein
MRACGCLFLLPPYVSQVVHGHCLAVANEFDFDLIGKCAEVGVASAIDGVSGDMGQDEDKEGMTIHLIEFEHIKGGDHHFI